MLISSVTNKIKDCEIGDKENPCLQGQWLYSKKVSPLHSGSTWLCLLASAARKKHLISCPSPH